MLGQCVHERNRGTRHRRMYGQRSFDASRCANVPMGELGEFPSTFLCIDRTLGHSFAFWRIGRPNDRLGYEHCENWRKHWKSIRIFECMVICVCMIEDLVVNNGEKCAPHERLLDKYTERHPRKIWMVASLRLVCKIALAYISPNHEILSDLRLVY